MDIWNAWAVRVTSNTVWMTNEPKPCALRDSTRRSRAGIPSKRLGRSPLRGARQLPCRHLEIGSASRTLHQCARHEYGEIKYGELPVEPLRIGYHAVLQRITDGIIR
jgi:hypothetical protein